MAVVEKPLAAGTEVTGRVDESFGEREPAAEV